MRKLMTAVAGLAVLASLAFSGSAQAETKVSTKGLAKFAAQDVFALDKKGDAKGLKSFQRFAEDSAYAYVKGRVTAVSASSVSVSVVHHTDGVTDSTITTVYTFSVDTNTKVIRKFKGTASISEVMVGDLVSVWASDLTNGHARLIWDQSIWWGQVKGTIANLDTTAKTFQLVLRTSENHGITTTSVATIHVNDSTTYSQGSTVKAFTDLANGQKVNLRGSWDNPGKFFLAKTVAIQE